MATISSLDRYSANLALFESRISHLTAKRCPQPFHYSATPQIGRDTHLAAVATSPATTADGTHSAAESRRRHDGHHRRRRLLHNSRFSDRSDSSSQASGASDPDYCDSSSSDDELARGRALTRAGEIGSDECSCASRVISSSRALLSDDEDENICSRTAAASVVSSGSFGNVSPEVRDEVARFQMLLEQAQLEERMLARHTHLQDGEALRCDDDDDDDDAYDSDNEADSEDYFDDDYDQDFDFPCSTSSVSSCASAPSTCLSTAVDSQIYMPDTDPSRVVHVNHIAKDIVPPRYGRRSIKRV
ncbi:uncharacterized protein V2V93DRAFT_382031 [Kockiozyma suomiensis]|uniref:uncharacterized protein n=1 Tax=Kockiozyma suomiensis TaxID=1337062 RepID=UPI003343EE6A